MKILPVVVDVFHADGDTKKLIAAYSNFVKASKRNYLGDGEGYLLITM